MVSIANSICEMVYKGDGYRKVNRLVKVNYHMIKFWAGIVNLNLKVIKSENYNIFVLLFLYMYNSYTKSCKIHPRITTSYGIIFSPVCCHNFRPKLLKKNFAQKKIHFYITTLCVTIYTFTPFSIRIFHPLGLTVSKYLNTPVQAFSFSDS